MDLQKCPYCGGTGKYIEDQVQIDPRPDGKSFQIYLSKKYECQNCGTSLASLVSQHETIKVRISFLSDEVRVALFQLRLSLGTEFRKDWSSDTLFVWDPEALNRRHHQISEWTQELSQLEPSLRILVFPELTVPVQAHEFLQQTAKKQQMVIIGGSFYREDRKNVCPIFLPDDVVYTEKIFRTKWEDGQLDTQRMQQGTVQYVLENAHGRWLMPIICGDFLNFYDLIQRGFRHYISMLLCIAATPQMEDFYRLANVYAQDSKFIGITCAVGEIHSADGQLGALKGGTSFFGNIHEFYQLPWQKSDPYGRLLHLCAPSNEECCDFEGVLVGTVDLENPSAATIPTRRTTRSYCNFRDWSIYDIVDGKLAKRHMS